MDRNLRARVMYAAEAYDKRTKARGWPGGEIGLTGLAILKLLLFRYGDRPAPSYATLARHSTFCLQTVSNALKRLRDAGFITIERRSIRTRLGSRRINNLYGVCRQTPPLPDGPLKKPLEKTFLKASFVPFDQWISPVRDKLEDIARRALEAMQESDAMKNSG